MSAILQFKDYHVVETHYKFKPFLNDEDSGIFKTTPRILYKLNVNPENIGEAVLFLGIELGDASLKTSEFYVKAIISGLFEIPQKPEGVSDEEVIDFYRINATTILFPYLRSIISDISSKGSESPIILPVMNIVEMIGDNKFEEVEEEFDELTSKSHASEDGIK